MKESKVFKGSKILMDEKAINRALTRISHEIIEKNKGTDDIVILGIKTRGVPLAQRIANKINEIEQTNIKTEVLDITFYRDDLIKKTSQPEINNTLSIDVHEKTVIIVDDVIYTGRTSRAALDAIMKSGRANKIQIVSLVDRGHRDLPIRPDFIGKNVPTSKDEVVHVHLKEVDGEDKVILS